MPKQQTTPPSFWTSRLWWAELCLIVAVLGAYSNSFQGAFVFDDEDSIGLNPTIHSLWPIGPVLQPPRDGRTVDGRPLLNLSLAINYALHETDVRGYHVFNLAVHLLASLTLFGVVRRTLRLPRFRERFETSSTAVALAVALLWSLHPLQTESVTYIIQRAESMMGLFYLLTLYAAIRGLEVQRPGWWHLAAIVSCTAGMASKEVTVSAPLAVMLYDRLFFFSSFEAAFQRRKWLYAGLAATWLLLLALVIPSIDRGGSAGLGHGVTPWQYLFTQAGAIVHYLRLSFWPDTLVLDYGKDITTSLADAVPPGIVVCLLLFGTVAALRYWPWIGFLGLCFFAILAPTSSIVPIVTQTVAEHRMYLPLAPLVTLVVVGSYLLWMKRLRARSRRRPPSRFLSQIVPTLAVAGVALAFAARTYVRNHDYRTQISMWEVTLRDRPQNPRPWLAYGVALTKQGQPTKALELFDRAIADNPKEGPAYDARGNAWQELGRFDKALADHSRAIELSPDWEGYNNRGLAHRRLGQLDRALEDHSKSLELNPHNGQVYYNRGVVYRQLGQTGPAIADFTRAIELQPDLALAYNDRGAVWQQLGRLDRAAADYTRTIELLPEHPLPYSNRAEIRKRQGRFSEAVNDLSKVLSFNPGHAQAYLSRAECYLALGRPDWAREDLYRAQALGAQPHPDLLRRLDHPVNSQ